MLKEVAPMHDISSLFEGGSSESFHKKIEADKQQRKKYKDAESAARAAYKFAADTAEAARAALQNTDGIATWKGSEKGNNKRGGKISDNKKSSHGKESEDRYKMIELEKLLHGLNSESSSGNFSESLKYQGKSYMESAENSGVNRPSFDRKPHSVRRTSRRYRLRSM
ncbi:hypothetical protein PTKIN_Ptkin12aG0056200 [Pterospermum kingtungense]